jgi:hypothetical protein
MPVTSQNLVHTAPAELADKHPGFQLKNLPPALRQINPRLRGMVRGHSDLGMRLRKKVTLRYVLYNKYICVCIYTSSFSVFHISSVIISRLDIRSHVLWLPLYFLIHENVT